MSLNNLFNKKIIFFGDSITDANRLLNPKYPNGFGYVSMINDDYAINHSYANITIVNKGISGNKTGDLLNRIVTGDYDLFKIESGSNTLNISGTITTATLTNYQRWLG